MANHDSKDYPIPKTWDEIDNTFVTPSDSVLEDHDEFEASYGYGEIVMRQNEDLEVSEDEFFMAPLAGDEDDFGDSFSDLNPPQDITTLLWPLEETQFNEHAMRKTAQYPTEKAEFDQSYDYDHPFDSETFALTADDDRVATAKRCVVCKEIPHGRIPDTAAGGGPAPHFIGEISEKKKKGIKQAIVAGALVLFGVLAFKHWRK